MDCKSEKKSTQKININLNEINAIQLHDNLSSIKNVNAKQEEYEKFKEKLKAFDNVKTVNEAKTLAKNILPTTNEINCLKVGDAKCVIIMRGNLFRILLQSAEEFICYNFKVGETENDRHQ